MAAVLASLPNGNVIRETASGGYVEVRPDGSAKVLSAEDAYWLFEGLNGADAPTCGVCDGYHSTTHCPLEDTGWMDSDEDFRRF